MPTITLPGVGRIEYQIAHQTQEPALVIASLPADVRPLAQEADKKDVYIHDRKQLGPTRRQVLTRFATGAPYHTRISEDIRLRTWQRAGGSNGLLERNEHDRYLPSRLLFWRSTERSARSKLHSIEDAVAQAVADRRQARDLLAGELEAEFPQVTQVAERRLRSAMSVLQSDRDQVLHQRLAEALDGVRAANDAGDVARYVQRAVTAVEDELAPSYHAKSKLVHDEVKTRSWVRDEFLD